MIGLGVTIGRYQGVVTDNATDPSDAGKTGPAQHHRESLACQPVHPGPGRDPSRSSGALGRSACPSTIRAKRAVRMQRRLSAR